MFSLTLVHMSNLLITRDTKLNTAAPARNSWTRAARGQPMKENGKTYLLLSPVVAAVSMHCTSTNGKRHPHWILLVVCHVFSACVRRLLVDNAASSTNKNRSSIGVVGEKK